MQNHIVEYGQDEKLLVTADVCQSQQITEQQGSTSNGVQMYQK